MSDATDSSALLSVRGLEKHYPVRSGWLNRETSRVRAVDGVSFDLRRGETLGLVGESGCGKSTVARTVLSLESPTAGSVTVAGQDIADQSRTQRKRFRRRVQIVFQDPGSSFDPRMTIGESVAEPIVAHGLDDAERRRERVESLLEVVGLAADDRERYPHELSGGQKQRAALARALSLNPDVLVLDEPVSALDVSVQAEILALVQDLQEAFDLAILLISHDMSVVERLCDRVAVMYLGELVERGPTESLFDDPKHPYTRALLAAIPDPDPHEQLGDAELDGEVPDPASPPDGCRFHTRCQAVIPPDDLDIDQSTFQSVFALRVGLRNGDIGLESVRERLGGDDETPSPAAVAAAVREEYGVAQELANERAERSLSEALTAFADGDASAASERLAETFPSVCERERPAQHRSDGCAVTCHHYRPDDSSNTSRNE
ncbi:oligopeptide/dipeptide ABC transporter ATP-binding protein [Halostella sp. PRR32]|uniref:ABC transporter ATP-binding protein n=1 Tax=Halostella sp. PRR32 TaxID=3098147 RepID=UPI002B1CF3CE|nr:oligopeptide/dipeptide ABC transporter ATP-binding protein [Halostella sp. PRR32]